jgi:hypothetical protein
MALQELYTSRNNHIVDVNTYVGQKDRLFFDLTTQTFRVSDGVTEGGQILGGIGAGSGSIGVELINDANVTSNLIPITTLMKFDSTAGFDIVDLGGGEVKITLTGGGVGGAGSANIEIKDENSTLTSSVSSINFSGAGISATHTGNAVTVSVTKGAGINKIVDVPDVYTGAGLANGQLLVYNYDSERWDTKTQLSNQNLDGGEF